jgi:hypothetical protein
LTGAEDADEDVIGSADAGGAESPAGRLGSGAFVGGVSGLVGTVPG